MARRDGGHQKHQETTQACVDDASGGQERVPEGPGEWAIQNSNNRGKTREKRGFDQQGAPECAPLANVEGLTELLALWSGLDPSNRARLIDDARRLAGPQPASPDAGADGRL